MGARACEVLPASLRTLLWPLGEALEASEHGAGGLLWLQEGHGLTWLGREGSGIRFEAVVFANVMSGVGGSILGSGLFSLAGILESKNIRAGRCFLIQPYPFCLRWGGLLC